MDVLLLIGRIAFGLYFLYSGLNHFRKLQMMTGYTASMKVPQPKLAVIVTGLMLLFGGLTLILGFWAKAGAVVLLVFLVPVSYKMHRYWGLPDPMMAANQQAHFLKNLALASANLMLVFFGSGPFSLG